MIRGHQKARSTLWLLRMAAIPIVLFFLWAGLLGLDRLGLYGDETIFINAALGGADGDFIQGRILGIPTYIMPYIGALKSWIYAPILWAFGVDPCSIRVPAVLISLATILLFSGFVRWFLGSASGLATLLLLCTDPGFLLSSRTDYGPTVLMGFMKALALVGFFRWLESPSAPRVEVWLVALALGIWNKLDFLWIVIACGAASLSLHGRAILHSFLAQGRRAMVSSALACFALLGFVFGPISQTLRSPPPAVPTTGILDRWIHIWSVLGQALDGRGMCEFQFPGLAHLGSEVMLLPLAGLLALPLLLVGRARSEGHPSLPMFFLFSSVLIFAQAVLTPQAGGAHHLLLLWPFPQLFAISVFACMHRRLSRPLRLIFSIVCASLFLFVVGTQVKVDLRYLSLLSKPELMSPKWSPRIYDLSREIESKDVDLIVSTDWGFHSQLSSLASSENRKKYRDLWIVMKNLNENPSQVKQLLGVLSGKRFLFLLHAERTEEQAPARQNSLHFLEANFPEQEILKMADAAGLPLYEVHIVDDS